ncbi:Shedu immune nuclease family protein [Janthinobacterium lividum]|uniref:DUF4263 domain-containing protein n=1 Tax=Janthinobacterium lividum TaxID=29581 RepID=A0ABU0XUA8_9BURK|nr:DUF4263 domain-containing protein [Janthinobacterium lividum]MDQ4627142.1 DUF4263 domain-containing protein [Janthinobacterium lividum]MDQ4675369.1 DUF4263 domain-containing protein [Janthinobacterium lividum]MDQ4686100.1 DUF4263 domain-containing protein [Janthinobacterium lividum]
MAKSVQQSLKIRDALYERIVYDCEKAEGGGTNVFYYLMPPPGHTIEHTSRWKLLHVSPDMLTIYPFSESAAGYKSKYKALDRIFVTAKRSHPYEEPTDEQEVEWILGELPEGLERNPLNGLGFTTQNRFILDSIAGLAHQIRIVIEGGNKQPYYDDGFYVLSQTYLKQLVRGMEAIASRYRRQAITDKRIFAYNELLSAIDPEAFPIKQKKVNATAIFELVKVGRVSTSLPKAAQRNVVDLVIDNAQSIAKNAPETLYALAAKIESVTLQEMIVKFEDMLGKDLNETKWQKFFEANTFILSMAFAVPTVFVKQTPYVHGKRISGQGGKFLDFLMRGQGTGNLALIEIKAPGTTLLSTYRNEQPGPSSELTGAITQVLGHRRRITTGWHNLKGEDDGTLKDTELHSPQAIILIGTMPTLKSDREAFEAFRNVLKDIAVITFNELLMRLKYLHQALTVQSPGLSAPHGMPTGTQPPQDNELVANQDDEIPF